MIERFDRLLKTEPSRPNSDRDSALKLKRPDQSPKRIALTMAGPLVLPVRKRKGERK